MSIEWVSIDDLEISEEVWPVDGIICPTFTIISGQPKYGKSALAGHCAMALINQQSILGREILPGPHKVAWMGFDPGWKIELKGRWQGQANNSLLFFNSLRSHDVHNWRELAISLKNEKVTLFVIDHLYGLAGSIGLNDAEQVYSILDLIRPIYEEFKIPVVLLAQATKNGFAKGRAAHSTALEGEARALVRIYEKGSKSSRKIDLSSNSKGEETLSVYLSDSRCELRSPRGKDESSEVIRDSPDRVRDFLLKANPAELKRGWKGTGRELYRLQFSENAEAGRAMARRWGNQNLLARSSTGEILSGPSLFKNIELAIGVA